MMIDIIKLNDITHVLNVYKPEAEKTVIFSHGFLSNKNKPVTKSTARSLSLAGFKTIRFNYGVEIVSERLKILKGIIKHAAKTSKSIGLVGNSLGGMVTLLAAKEPIVKSIALINSVYDPLNARDNYVKNNKLFANTMIAEVRDEFINYDLKKVVKGLTKPTLVISSELDRIIPQKQSKRLYLELKGEKKFVNLRGATHSIWNQQQIQRVREEIREWFKTTL